MKATWNKLKSPYSGVFNGPQPPKRVLPILLLLLMGICYETKLTPSLTNYLLPSNKSCTQHLSMNHSIALSNGSEAKEH